MAGDIVAYIRKPDDRLPDYLLAEWELTGSEACIMNTSHENLIFVEEIESQAEALALFRDKYPGPDPELCCIKYEQCSWNNKIHGDLPRKFMIFPYYWYPGHDAATAARLAQESEDGYILCHVENDGFQANTRWPIQREYDQKKQRYLPSTCALDDYDCYERVINRQIGNSNYSVLEVVYNPKLVERRVLRRQQNAAAAVKAPLGALTINEVNTVIRGLVDLIPRGNFVQAPEPYASRRDTVAYNLKKALNLIWLLFDDTAHRQCDAFQELLAQWRKPNRAEATRTAWSASPLWDFLDEEVKRRKPKKRVLACRAIKKW
jgi:hypothetical protein